MDQFENLGAGGGLIAPYMATYGLVAPLLPHKNVDKSSRGNKPIFRGNKLTFGLWGNKGAISPYVGQ